MRTRRADEADGLHVELRAANGTTTRQASDEPGRNSGDAGPHDDRRQHQQHRHQHDHGVLQRVDACGSRPPRRRSSGTGRRAASPGRSASDTMPTMAKCTGSMRTDLAPAARRMVPTMMIAGIASRKQPTTRNTKAMKKPAVGRAHAPRGRRRPAAPSGSGSRPAASRRRWRCRRRTARRRRACRCRAARCRGRFKSISR